MSAQLTLDNLYLVAQELLARSMVKDTFELSLVSQAVHAFTYPLVLKADAYPTPPLVTSCDRCLFDTIARGAPRPLSALKHFISTDDASLVARYLEVTRFDVNTVIHDKRECYTLLCLAAKSDARSVASLLLKAGAKQSWPRRGISPLDYAMTHDRVHITKLLLDHGGIQEYIDECIRTWGCLPASREPNAHLLSCIVQLVSPWGNQASVEMINALLPYSSNLNELDRRQTGGLTILNRICRQEIVPEKAVAIVQGGVTIDALTSGEMIGGRCVYRTALNDASRNFHPQVIRALLEKGASIQGASAYDFARLKDDSQPHITHVAPTPLYDLLDRMNHWLFFLADSPDEIDSRAWKTHKRKILESIRVLIDHGLSDQQGLIDESGNVLFDIQFACARLRVDSDDLWALLLEGGVLDVHRRDQFGQTFLAQLCSRCFGQHFWRKPLTKHNLVRALIRAGSDLNTVDTSGMTPLHWAIFYCDMELLQILLDGGADPSIEIDGATPVHYAFGKRFARQGPVMKKAMAVLRSKLPRMLRLEALTEPSHFQAYSQYRKRKWHPMLSLKSSRSWPYSGHLQTYPKTTTAKPQGMSLLTWGYSRRMRLWKDSHCAVRVIGAY
ncbi:ankyrin repeat-containing domain protein [Nemania sp. NC0429]|nr:ankyrin repeat-containing domain protein [Nemania sp. NC0429]